MQASDAGKGLSEPAAIAARLREVRESLQLSQQGFADLLGVKRQQLVDVERGKAKPSPELQAAAIQKASVNPIWLASGGGQMLQKQSLSFDQVIEIARLAAMEVQALDVPDEMRRAAQDWLIAIKSRNTQRLRELVALQSSTAPRDSASGQSAARLDPQVLEMALGLIDGAMLAEGVTVASKKRASLIAAVYDMCQQDQPPKDLVRTLVRLAA